MADGSTRAASSTGAPRTEERTDLESGLAVELPWLLVVWNDPINMMNYVTFVFQKIFGFSLEKAERLMLDVHTKGRAVVASGPREHLEMDCSRLHRAGLSATLEPST